jgi:non-reducing end alpha-L-arabinofuranosidase
MKAEASILLASFALYACRDTVTEQGFLVKVSNPDHVPGIVQLRASVSSQTDPRDHNKNLLFPATATDKTIDFDTSFSFTISADRSGDVDIIVEGLSSQAIVVAHAMTTSVSLEAGKFPSVNLLLKAGAARPCDIYAAGKTPCVAAHSTVRALFGAYSGSLYQVRRDLDNTFQDIAALPLVGVADADSQNQFCKNTICVITKVYDQSGNGNHLGYQGPGSTIGGLDDPASATGESVMVAGHKAYSLYLKPGNSYWVDGSAKGVPKGNAAESIYMVTSGTHTSEVCCFDYGNSETDRIGGGAGSMDAIYFGTNCWWKACSGTGPWVQADFEEGIYPGGSKDWNPNQKALTSPFVTAMLKNNGTTSFALKGGDAQSGSLDTLYDGTLPAGYGPMKKQGAIVLGSGGNCCSVVRSYSEGTFYEGAIVAGYATEATDNVVRENIRAAGYTGIATRTTFGAQE